VGKRQRTIFLSAISLITVMFLFPPWLYYDANTSNQASAGYHFLFSPPPVKTYEQLFGIPGDEVLTTRHVRARMNVTRLITQILSLLFIAMGLQQRQRGRPVLAGCLIGLGLCTIGLFTLLVMSKY
jgi:hypothetical protein